MLMREWQQVCGVCDVESQAWHGSTSKECKHVRAARQLYRSPSANLKPLMSPSLTIDFHFASISPTPSNNSSSHSTTMNTVSTGYYIDNLFQSVADSESHRKHQ